jgi:hypothetical protein
VYNSRSPEQWLIVKRHLSVKGKTVIDLGCGHADLLLCCWADGAECIGVDKQAQISVLPAERFTFLELDLDRDLTRLPACDIALCFSVLPYLAYPLDALTWMQNNSQVALIECQYRGDGPGDKPWLPTAASAMGIVSGDKQMRALLRKAGWARVEAIGQTQVEGRGVSRTIWMCSEGPRGEQYERIAS